MEISLHNSSPSVFTGWVRRRHATPIVTAPATLVDARSKAPLGKIVPADHNCYDLYIKGLLPFTRTTVLVDAEAPLHHPPAPPTFATGFKLNDKQMDLVPGSLKFDGAAYVAEFVGRNGPLLLKLWARHYPGQPWIEGTMLLLHTDPTSPHLTHHTFARVTTDSGIFLQPGRKAFDPVCEIDYLADGQGKFLPFAVLDHLATKGTSVFPSFPAVLNLQISAHGMEGNPLYPDGDVPPSGEFGDLEGAIARLYTFEPNKLGPNIRSGDTGEQEDQFYHPCSQIHSETIRMLEAGKSHAEKPANHREWRGEQLSLQERPSLRMWDCRPHLPTTGDMLGKTDQLTEGMAHGRSGPDTQHWLTSSLGRALHRTGDPALHDLLCSLATNYLCMRTLTGSTAGIWSGREIGYECEFVLRDVIPLVRDDRLREACENNLRERLVRVILPHLEQNNNEYFFAYEGGMHPGKWAATWHDSIAVWPLMKALEHFGLSTAPAEQLAYTCFRTGWVKVDGRWKTRETRPLDSSPQLTPKESWNGFAMPMCVAAMIDRDLMASEVLQVCNQLVADGDFRWLPPIIFDHVQANSSV